MTGKEKCNLLRQIRKEIAEVNNIIYLSAECEFEGECLGTCPKCDAEIRYLNNEINKKITKGEKVELSNISMGSFFDNYDQNSTVDDFENCSMGAEQPVDIEEEMFDKDFCGEETDEELWDDFDSYYEKSEKLVEMGRMEPITESSVENKKEEIRFEPINFGDLFSDDF